MPTPASFLCVAAGLTCASAVGAETIARYNFDNAGSGIAAFHPTETADFVVARKAIGNGYSADVNGNGRLHLGRVADFGDVRANGRGIFHLLATNQRLISPQWLAFDFEVLASLGYELDSLEALINGVSVGVLTDLADGHGSAVFDVRSANVEDQCVTIEVRAQDAQESTMGVAIDNLLLLGETSYDQSAASAQCLDRVLELDDVIAFYDFRDRAYPTYAHPLLSAAEVTDATGGFLLGGGGYNEEVGLFSHTAAHLPPRYPDDPNFYTFAIRVLNGAKVHLDRITVRAAGQGTKENLPRKMSISLNSTELAEFAIDGVTRAYSVDVGDEFDRLMTLDVSIWDDFHTLNGIVDEVLLTGRVSLDGANKTVDAIIIPD